MCKPINVPVGHTATLIHHLVLLSWFTFVTQSSGVCLPLQTTKGMTMLKNKIKALNYVNGPVLNHFRMLL